MNRRKETADCPMKMETIPSSVLEAGGTAVDFSANFRAFAGFGVLPENIYHVAMIGRRFGSLSVY